MDLPPNFVTKSQPSIIYYLMVLLETRQKIAARRNFSVTIFYQIGVLDCFVAKNRVGINPKR
jgi:hypothetical protein